MVFRKLQSRPNLRVLFFFVVLFAGSFLVMGISFATAWFVFRSRRISPAFAPLILHPTWFLLLFLFRRYLDKKSVSGLGISLDRGWLRKLWGGILLGFLLILLVYAINLLVGGIEFSGFAWNFAQGEVFGFPLYGSSTDSLLVSSSGGRVLLTGGNFGPEASVLSTIFLLILIFLIFSRIGTQDGPGNPST